MIRAIIFDCFGVLVAASLEAFCYKYLHNEPKLIEQVRALDHATNLGVMPYEDFIQKLAGLAGIDVEQTRRFLDNTPPNLELFDYIKAELKPKYKIGFISNASENWLDELFTKEQIDLFDDVVLSCKVKLVKPDERIYRLAAERLRVRMDECIFVDDIPRYCDAAREAGMKAVLYHDVAPCKEDIARLL